MKREIKFRAWDGHRMFCPVMIKEDGKVFSDLWTTDEWPVMQFTGLHDKNGIEIYEGDVMQHKSDLPETFYIVRYNSTFAAYEVDDIKRDVFEEGFEIIGNIYEHPHLLETV